MSQCNDALVDQVKRGLRIENGIVYGVTGKPRKIKKTRSKSGYIKLEISVYYKGKNVNISIARLIAYFKYGNKLFEEGIVTRHLNGNSEDYSFDNIAIGTTSDNMMDIPREERIKHAQLASSYRRKYSDELEDQICQEYRNGFGYGTVGKKFNIPKSTIRSMLIRRKVI